MKIKELRVESAWQFTPHDNQGQPDFVHVQTALGGPRAIVRPPVPNPSVPGMQPVILHLAPTDWVIGLGGGVYIQMNAHAAQFILHNDDTVEDAPPVPGEPSYPPQND